MVAPNNKPPPLFDRFPWTKSNREALAGIRRFGILSDVHGPLAELVTERLVRLRLEARLRSGGFEVGPSGDDLRAWGRDFAPLNLQIHSAPAGSDRALMIVVRLGVEREVLVRTNGKPVRRTAGLFDVQGFRTAPAELAAEAVLDLVDRLADEILAEVVASGRSPAF